MAHLTAAQRGDCLTELREIHAEYATRAADTHRLADWEESHDTMYETAGMKATRHDIAAAYRALAAAQSAYRTRITIAIAELEGGH